MKSFDAKRYLPHLLSIAGLILVAILFAWPAFEGQELAQGDNISWKAISREASAWHERTGENTLWSNSQFGGMPTYTFYVPESNNLIAPLYHLVTGMLPKPANFLALAMICFYILGSVLRWDRWLRVAGAVAFGLSAYNPIIISAGHETKMIAIAFMPAVLAGMFLIFRGRYLQGGALFALSMALFISTAHYQINYYMAIALALVGLGFLVIAIRERWVPRFLIATGIALVTGLLGVGVTTVVLGPTAEYNKLTMRGGESELTINKTGAGAQKTGGGLDKEYAFRWSNSIGETGALLVPDLYGGGSAEDADRLPKTSELVGPQYEQLPGYWGQQPFVTGADHYLGAIVCFLALLGMLVIRNPLKWAFAAACMLAIVMSWGRHFPDFNYFLFDHLPMLKNFRTPSMVLVIPQFLFPVLGIWGLHEILSGRVTRAEAWKSVQIAAGTMIGLCLLLGLFGGMFFELMNPEKTAFMNPEKDASYPAQMIDALKEDRQALARNSAMLSAFWIAATAGLIWAYTRDKLKPNAVAIGAAALILLDLFPVAKRYLNNDNFQDSDAYTQNFQPRPVDQQILQDKDPYYRVLDLSRDPYNDAQPAYFHKLVGGYSPAKMESYQDLIDVHLTPQKGMNTAVLRMLNTKYIITPGGEGGQPAVFPMPDPAGNAWFVEEVKLVATADEQMLAMAGPKLGDTAAVPAASWNPLKTAIARNTYANALAGYAFGKDSAASVRLKQYGLNAISFTSSNSRPGLAVFSDVWYPHGWKAFVDGKEEPIMCANYLLRALKVPAGQHTIEFKFEPESFANGNRISLICSALILALVAVGIVAEIRRKKAAGDTGVVVAEEATVPIAAKKNAKR